jgi:hypothetical protein
VTRNKGSENAQRRQRPLLGCPTTQVVNSQWNRAGFPKDE